MKPRVAGPVVYRLQRSADAVITTAIFETVPHLRGAPDVLIPRDTWEALGSPDEVIATITAVEET